MRRSFISVLIIIACTAKSEGGKSADSSAAPLKTIDLAPQGAGFLNDLAIGPDGDFYITDTGVRPVSGNLQHVAPDRIYHVDRNRKVTIALENSLLASPDGIAWDPAGRR